MVIRELLMKFGFEVDESKLDNLQNRLKSNMASMRGLALAAAGLYTGLTVLTKQTAAYADNVAKKSRTLGMSIEKYQELEHAADLANTSMGSLGSAFRRVQRNAGSAAQGSKAAQLMFQNLGLEIRNSVTGELKTADQLLVESADKFKAIESTTERNALATQLFGLSYESLMPLLMEGSDAIRANMKEARELGVVTEDDAIKAENFNDNITRFNRVIQNLKRTLAFAFMPVITDIIEQFRAWWKLNKDMIKSSVEKWVRIIGGVLKIVASNLKLIVAAFAIIKISKMVVNMVSLGRALFDVAKALKGINGLAALLSGKLALIAGSIALVLLIIDDIATYMDGGDSVIGRFIAKFENDDGFLGGFAKFVKNFAALLGKTKDLVGGWDRLIAIMAGMWAVIKLKAFIGMIGTLILKVKALAAANRGASTEFPGIAPSRDLPNSGPAGAPAGAPRAPGGGWKGAVGTGVQVAGSVGNVAALSGFADGTASGKLEGFLGSVGLAAQTFGGPIGKAIGAGIGLGILTERALDQVGIIDWVANKVAGSSDIALNPERLNSMLASGAATVGANGEIVYNIKVGEVKVDARGVESPAAVGQATQDAVVSGMKKEIGKTARNYSAAER